MPTTRLYTTVLLPTGPLSDCILLFYYPQAHYQTVYYCYTTHMPTKRLYTTVLLPTGPLPDCILLFCYPHAHYQTIYYCCTTHMPTNRLYMYATIRQTTGPLSDCILLGLSSVVPYPSSIVVASNVLTENSRPTSFNIPL